MSSLFKEYEVAKIASERDGWQEHLHQKLATAPQRKDAFSTVSGKEVGPLYTPADTKDFDYRSKLGFPGYYPYTRGVQTSMYRGRLWTMRMFAGLGSAKDTNKRFHMLVKEGQTGLFHRL